MASFDENGKYIKTNWKAGDKITATKLNKIEESIEAVNDNDISRHVEADARLDALEAKDVAHDKEFTNVKNLIADNKAAAELGDYEINSRMQFLEQELNEGIEEVHNVATTVDGKITAAEANMEAMVAEVEADLEELYAKDEELSAHVKKMSRKFKPTIGNFLDLNPNGGQMINETEIDEALSNCKKYGIETIVIQPWVTWNESTLSLKNDLDRLKYIEEKCIEIGLKVACLKLHMYSINYNGVSDITSFKNQYKNIVQLLCDKFNNSSIDLFIPFNECYGFYKKDSEHLTFTNEVLDIVKSSGFKCGISTMGGAETVGMDLSIKDKVDVFCVNSYPKISYKRERTTLEDSISSWNSSYELKCYKEMKRQYPFKDIIMSETGCNDQWICLANPGDWTLSENYNTNGKAPALMLEGLFNSDFKDIINDMWWCYYPTILNDECKNIIERYIGGINEL